jgi:hypothetical protein
MKWVGEGPHLGLLEHLLELGLDPSEAGSKLFPCWPRSCNPDWQTPYMIDDPFYVEAIVMLVNVDLGTPPLSR